MSTLEDLDDLEQERKEEKKDEDKKDKDGKKDGKENGKADGDAEMKDVEPEEEDDPIFDEIETLSTQDIITRRRLLENDSRIMKSEFSRLSHEKATMGEKIKDNNDKIENNRHVDCLPDRIYG
jgi:26S proteasome regulatory subunit T5